MFSNKTAKQEAEELAASNNIFGKGTLIEGHIESAANIRLEGKLVGDVVTKAKLVVSESGKIEGNVHALNAEIAGAVTGNLIISNLLILKPTAIVKGDILVGKLGVEVGATLNGTCKMASEIAPIRLKENGTIEGEKAA